MIIMLAATTIFGLALLAMPAAGLVRFPTTSPELLLQPSTPGLPRQPVQHDRVSMTPQRVWCSSCSTIMTTAPGGMEELYGSGGGGGSRSSRSKQAPCAIITGQQSRGGGLDRRARTGKDRNPWSLKSMRRRGVICRAGGGEGGLYDDDDEEERKEDAADEKEEEEQGEQSPIIITGGGGGDDDDDDDDDSPPAFSFSAIENELQSRSATTTMTAKSAAGQNRRSGMDRGGGGGGGGMDQDESAWLPRFFPPPPPGDQDGEGDDSGIQPLLELPLDGILLQLFPALLIGVVGTFLTIAVQFEASKFDGMVGEDGGAVVVTDLRDTRTDDLP